MESTPTKVQAIFDEILSHILPTNQEQAHYNTIISKISAIITNSAPSSKITINFIEPQGSTGIKNTALRNAADIDLFIGLDPSILGKPLKPNSKTRKQIRSLFKDLISTWLIPELERQKVENPVMNYAEHPYISAKLENIDLDIVFCFDVSDQFLFEHGPLTAVDRSPHHSRYIQQHMSSLQRDEVRILKYVFQVLHCYGDKSAVGRSGFIGYLAEIFILHYGSVWNFMKNISELTSKVIFLPPLNPNIKNPYTGLSREEVQEKYFPNDYYIVIDPTDIHRNVASSISSRAYRVVQHALQLFVNHPTQEFFIKKSLPHIQNLQIPYPLENFFFIEFETSDYAHYTKFRDKLYSFMDKLTAQAKQEATLESRFENPVGELLFDAERGKYVLSLFTSTPKISQEFTRIGPKEQSGEHAEKFQQKNPSAFLAEGKWCVIKPRPFSEFIVFIKDFAQKNPIKNLKLVSVGNAAHSDYSQLVGRSMGNLAINILPFELAN